jgi:enoyl-CoA hydratase/carnithine racemase
MQVDMDLSSAVDLLNDPSGDEVLGVLAGQPLLVVDLDTGGDPKALQVPATLPAVVVGITRAEQPPDAQGCGVDVAISLDGAGSRPWVTGRLQDLEGALDRNPQASVALAQVLRASEGVSIEAGLVIESLAYSTLQAGAEFRRWLEERPAAPSRRRPEPHPVLADTDAGLLTITLNRPQVHNCYNAAMRDALCEALSLAAADPSLVHVSLRGAGPSFCSGGDLTEFGSFADPATAHLVRTARSPARLLAGLSLECSAYLHGACVGSGIELPAFAGTVWADPDTQIRLPEIGMGLIPGAGGTVSIPRRIGRQRTAWLALTGRTVDAPTACGWGLVDRISEPA